MHDLNGIPRQQLTDLNRRGTRAKQPYAHDVIPGTLYFVTDEEVLERSNGTEWESYAGTGGGVGFGSGSMPLEILTTSPYSVGAFLAGSWGNSPFPLANMAIYYPLWIAEDYTFDTVVTVNNATAPGDNFDFGIYNATTGLKVVSLGSTAVTGSASTRVEYAITETTLTAGQYYMAVAKDVTTSSFQGMNIVGGLSWIGKGMGFQESAFPLPASFSITRTNARNPHLLRIGILKSGAPT